MTAPIHLTKAQRLFLAACRDDAPVTITGALRERARRKMAGAMARAGLVAGDPVNGYAITDTGAQALRTPQPPQRGNRSVIR